MGPKKRKTSESPSTDTLKAERPSSTILGISRSISACQRCRVKKIRCDQNFPKCSKCEKAGVECIGLDPATGRKVPRSYVIHLEDKVSMLEERLREHGVDPDGSNNISKIEVKQEQKEPLAKDAEGKENKSNEKVAEANDNKNTYLGTASGISFAKLMFTALRVNKKTSMVTPQDPSISLINESVLPAILPPKKTALEFIKIYFAQSNSQLPILHREEFIKNWFIPIYGKLEPGISLASNYTAINTSIFQDRLIDDEETWFYQYKQYFQDSLKNNNDKDAINISNNIIPPKKYHKPLYFLNMVFAIASSVHHLQYPTTISDAFKAAANKYIDTVYSSTDQLESLQGILLLALHSIMRPAVPGVWYVLGSALRACVDLGLHSESNSPKTNIDSFTKDKRRRLFWCTYSIDRQICFYLNRPVGIPDESINTPFPSELDDALIIPNDDKNLDYSTNIGGMPTYKSISLSFFKIRQIQSEVQKILYENSEIPRKYKTLNDWRKDISKKLQAWKNNSPKTPRKMNCDFNLVFISLNYNHTLLMIHGFSPKNYKLSVEDFSKVNEASKELISCYTQLHETKSINYTWAAVHNLFMAGISYLYTIYNSEEVRKQNSLFEVKQITSECLNVLSSLIDRCDAASVCRDIFENLAMVIIKLRYNETVHVYSSNLLNEKISKIKDGNLNSNLTKLVENLNENSQKYNEELNKLENNLNPFKQSQSPYGHESLEEVSQSIIQQILHSNNNGLVADQPPATFEWISDTNNFNNNSNLEKSSNQQQDNTQYDLNTFFNELENLSPASSRRGSLSDPNVLIYQSNNKSNQDTPQSNVSNFSNTSSPVSLNNHNAHHQQSIFSKDGKKVFEFIHQMPTESIWDQFFTTISSNTGIGLNPGLVEKE